MAPMNRNRKWKRTLILVLVLLLLPALLMGCGRRGSARKKSESHRKPGVSRETVAAATQPAPTLPEPLPTQAPAPEPEAPARREPLVYSDNRIPSYTGTDPKWERLRFDWVCQNGRGSAWMEVDLDVRMYEHYRGLSRYYGVENFHLYINDENNARLVRQVVNAMRDVAEALSYDDSAVAREMAKFVQDCIVYEYDSDTTGQDEFPRYPIETLYERRGDCEDTSILMAALLKEWGYEVGFLHLPGHVAVALRTSDDYNAGPYYEINGHRYLYIESTGSGWLIGEIPEDCQGVQAEFYLIP